MYTLLVCLCARLLNSSKCINFEELKANIRRKLAKVLKKTKV